MTKLIWEKVYHGPFGKKEAQSLVDDLKKVANPEVNMIYDATIRKRPKLDQYDVYCKTEKLSTTKYRPPVI